MREHRGQLPAISGAFASERRNERDGFAVELGLADQEAGGNGDADPAVLEDVNREIGATRGKFAVDVQVVVDTGESGLDGRWFRFALGRIGLGPEALVLVETDDDPSGAGRTRGLLRKAGWWGEEK
jgi:hypothetical protein